MCLSENNMSEAARNLNVDVDCALEKVCRVFGVSKHFPQQKKAIKAFISRKDVLVNLPMGFGKSLISQIALVVHAELSKFNNTFAAKPVMVIISPLLNLIEDQKNSLRALGIKTGCVGKDMQYNLAIENEHNITVKELFSSGSVNVSIFPDFLLEFSQRLTLPPD